MPTESREPGASTGTLDISWMAAAAIGVIAPIVGLVIGLHYLLHRTAVFVPEIIRDGDIVTNQFQTQHTTLWLGTAVLIGGFLLGALAWIVVISVHAQVAPRLAEQQRLQEQTFVDGPA